MSETLSPDLLMEAAITKYPSPLVPGAYSRLSREEKISAIAVHMKGILDILGLDTENESLQKTPERVATMYVDEVFSGLNLEALPRMALFGGLEGDSFPSAGRMVVTKVRIISFCEHHLVPMIGTAYIGYIPQDRVIGLSKISRIAQYFAARPQLQERLSAQIGDCLATVLGHPDVAVLLTAQHLCVIARGAKDESAETTTLFTSGAFQNDPDIREEFFSLINVPRTSSS